MHGNHLTVIQGKQFITAALNLELLAQEGIDKPAMITMQTEIKTIQLARMLIIITNEQETKSDSYKHWRP